MYLDDPGKSERDGSPSLQTRTHARRRTHGERKRQTQGAVECGADKIRVEFSRASEPWFLRLNRTQGRVLFFSVRGAAMAIECYDDDWVQALGAWTCKRDGDEKKGNKTPCLLSTLTTLNSGGWAG